MPQSCKCIGHPGMNMHLIAQLVQLLFSLSIKTYCEMFIQYSPICSPIRCLLACSFIITTWQKLLFSLTLQAVSHTPLAPHYSLLHGFQRLFKWPSGLPVLGLVCVLFSESTGSSYTSTCTSNIKRMA